jgi:hypothetical protein
MGLRSPVLLDEQLAVGPAFGAPGMPSAVLVDERGNIASELAVGARRYSSCWPGYHRKYRRKE